MKSFLAFSLASLVIATEFTNKVASSGRPLGIKGLHENTRPYNIIDTGVDFVYPCGANDIFTRNSLAIGSTLTVETIKELKDSKKTIKVYPFISEFSKHLGKPLLTLDKRSRTFKAPGIVKGKEYLVQAVVTKFSMAREKLFWQRPMRSGVFDPANFGKPLRAVPTGESIYFCYRVEAE